MLTMEANSITKSVSDYLLWVKECHDIYVPQIKASYFYFDTYFRGHASTSWELLPSLFREKGVLHNEQWMLNKANNLLWKKLGDCQSCLEKLVKLQHYGLHTRLLDITFNPLIALYFACQEANNLNDSKDGIVYSGNLNENNVKASEAIAEYIFKNDPYQISENDIERICKSNQIERNILESISIINPPQNNDRISAQSGAFIMPPLIKRQPKEPYLYANHDYIKSSIEQAFNKSFVIPHEDKKNILLELDGLGINRATIFTDMYNKLCYINEREEQEWKTIDLS